MQNEDGIGKVIDKVGAEFQREAEEAAARKIRYPHNALEGFANGCLLDLRVRFAMQLLTHSPRYQSITHEVANHAYAMTAEVASKDALDVATYLLAEADRRGLIDPLPDHDDLNAATRQQARRLGKFNIEQQLAAQREAQDQQGRVAVGRPN